MGNEYIIYSKELKDGLAFAGSKLAMEQSNEHFIFSTNFEIKNTERLNKAYPNAITFFITKGLNPGDDGVWDAQFIIDDKKEIDRWKNMLIQSS